jgi:hypothetical protein
VANPPDYGFTSSAPETAAPQESGGNGLAVAGLVLGIISLPAVVLSLLDVPIAILGIIFGAVGLSKAKKLGGKNKGMAMAGLICGIIGLIASVALFFWAMAEMKKELEHHRFRNLDSMVVPAPSTIASQPFSILAGDPVVYTIAEHG